MKEEIVKKLTKKQVFILCLAAMFLGASIVTLVCLVAPEALPTLFGVL